MVRVVFCSVKGKRVKCFRNGVCKGCLVKVKSVRECRKPLFTVGEGGVRVRVSDLVSSLLSECDNPVEDVSFFGVCE